MPPVGNVCLSTWHVPGDQVAHQQWRLLHGETFVANQPKVVVLLIGTNDLGASACLGGQANITAQAAGTADSMGVHACVYIYTHMVYMHVYVLHTHTHTHTYKTPSEAFRLWLL